MSRVRLSITKSTFKNNEANWYGGALYLYGESTRHCMKKLASVPLTRGACTQGPMGTWKGRQRSQLRIPPSITTRWPFPRTSHLAPHRPPPWSLTRLRVLLLQAYYNGGAVHLNGLYGNLTASFSNILWTGNWATDGGGLANLFGQVRISDSVLRNNEATHYGGGVFQYTVSQTSPDAYSRMSNVNFVANSDSDVSGDLYFFDDAGNSALLCNCSFTEIHANETRVVVVSDAC